VIALIINLEQYVALSLVYAPMDFLLSAILAKRKAILAFRNTFRLFESLYLGRTSFTSFRIDWKAAVLVGLVAGGCSG